MFNETEFLSPLGEKALFFRRLDAREELGRLPEYRVELLRLSSEKPLEPDALLGLKATVRIEVGPETFRHVNGVVTLFEQGGTNGRFDIYKVELRPWLWQLTLGADCRIFQDMTAVEILDQVFIDYGSPAVDKRLNTTFRTRPYTVQYRESDFDFVSRLMEEEGIYYYFTHQRSEHTLVLCDSPSAHSPMTGGKLYWAPRQTDNQLREDVVKQWSRKTVLRSNKYTHTDFSPDTPTLDLTGNASRPTAHSAPHDLEVFDYPGGYEDLAKDASSAAKKKEAGRLAKIRVDAFEAGYQVATGTTPWRHMAAGVTFNLEDHAAAAGYLVTRVDYRMEFAGYEANPDAVSGGFSCRFDAVPKSIDFQPQPIAVRPKVYGPQTATVVGPSGDEIHTDKYGRVRLHFHWDRVGSRNEKSSCWVRVSHPSAGKNFGALSLPRIGDEVVVDFLEGNPDRPLVTGRVYNGDNLPPYELPKYANTSGVMTRATKGGAEASGNELLFFDTMGEELAWMKAEKDMTVSVRHDYRTWAANDHQLTVTGASDTFVGKTMNLTVQEKVGIKLMADHDLTIGGDSTEAIGGASSLQVEGDRHAAYKSGMKVSVGQAVDLDVGAGLKVTAAAAMHLKGLGVVIDGGTQLTIKAGGAFITLGPEGVSIQGTMVKINSGGSAGTASAASKANPPKAKEPAEAGKLKDPLGR
jgi:type VI secretion system secreted protein VgrG